MVVAAVAVATVAVAVSIPFLLAQSYNTLDARLIMYQANCLS
jgi:hypothetical protein